MPVIVAGTGDLRFSFRATKAGDVAIAREGRVVTVLRGAAARRFLSAVAAATADAAQRLMARATGNYRRGNERVAAAHPRRAARR